MTVREHLAKLRAAMAAFPSLESHTANRQIDPDEIYFPRSHAAVLDPERSLVVGNRGMGKSFWANALVQPETRARIVQSMPESRLGQGSVEIVYGFAEGEGNVGVSREELGLLLDGGSAVETIWRAVTLPKVAELSGRTVPDRLVDRLAWVQSNPADVRDLLRGADQTLAERNSRLVFVFDQLEQLSDDLQRRLQLIQGILRLALAYKSYGRLRLKVFMRPDQKADDRVFAFPDASKISGEAVYLDWRPTDLYGLLYSRLRRAEREAFDAIATEAAISMASAELPSDLPISLIDDERPQHRLFDHIAGQFMGSSKKRGFPYTWLVLHLADARNQVSPRTFLRAITFAAGFTPAPEVTAIDRKGIHEGVNEAAKNRVDDLKEDYPWVPPVLQKLSGLLVPCATHEIVERLRDSSIFDDLRRTVPDAKKPEWLTIEMPSIEATVASLLVNMYTIGVVDIRKTTNKIDIPDIFRLPDDIRRRGGVTPQQRRKARIG
jgi:hypothetical protein